MAEEAGGIEAVVALGNPETRYERTRHNAGARVLEAFRRRLRAPALTPSGPVGVSRGRWRGRPVWLVRPATYMNHNGPPVAAWIRSQGLSPGEALVLCDDIDLPLGRIRLRRRGGSGGHRGLESLILALGTEDFPRLRIGIGPVPEGRDPAEFVLEEWNEREEEVWAHLLPWCVEAVGVALAEGLEAAMNRFNGAEGPPGILGDGGRGGA
jgi:PTH1 family peptidyl-tRNA hydrolase